MGRCTVLLVILFCYHLLFVIKVHASRDLSAKNELDREIHREIHLNFLNKPSTKALKILLTPLNHNSSGRDSTTSSKSFDTHLKTGIFSHGTIPIQKTIEDPVAERHILEVKDTEGANRANTYIAVARTKLGSNKYSGGGCYIKVENPKVVGQQFSATRIKLQGGGDSIEAGWRVDPSLYGDSKTRLFVRTDAGKTHCFDTRCPGFIQLHHGLDLGAAFENVSIPGGTVYIMRFNIIRDSKNGNWNFVMGDDSTLIGYWPSHIFTGLNGLADRVEWGGAAYSPPGTPLPPMGSGNHPIGHSQWDGFIAQIKVMNEKGQFIDAYHTDIYEDNPKFYSVDDVGRFDDEYRHVILYGGPGH